MQFFHKKLHESDELLGKKLQAVAVRSWAWLAPEKDFYLSSIDIPTRRSPKALTSDSNLFR